MQGQTLVLALSIAVAISSLSVLFFARGDFSINHMLDQYEASNIKSNLTPYFLSLPNEQLTDEELIEKTRDLEEVKLLLAKYPNAASHASVTRWYETGSPYKNIWVQYVVDKDIIVDASTGYSEAFQLNLVVQYERETNKSSGVSVYCSSPQAYHQVPAGPSTGTEVIENDYCFEPETITGVGNQY